MTDEELLKFLMERLAVAENILRKIQDSDFYSKDINNLILDYAAKYNLKTFNRRQDG